MTKTEIIQIFAGFVGTMGFAVLFNIRGIKLFITSLGGFIAWLLFVLLSKCIFSEPIIYFIVALIVSLFAEIMARVIKTPTSTFIITSLVPLIPGSSLYYTMAYAFQQDFESFVQKGIYTLYLAAALALGIIVSTTMTRCYIKMWRKKHSKLISKCL